MRGYADFIEGNIEEEEDFDPWKWANSSPRVVNENEGSILDILSGLFKEPTDPTPPQLAAFRNIPGMEEYRAPGVDEISAMALTGPQAAKTLPDFGKYSQRVADIVGEVFDKRKNTVSGIDWLSSLKGHLTVNGNDAAAEYLPKSKSIRVNSDWTSGLKNVDEPDAFDAGGWWAGPANVDDSAEPILRYLPRLLTHEITHNLDHQARLKHFPDGEDVPPLLSKFLEKVLKTGPGKVFPNGGEEYDFWKLLDKSGWSQATNDLENAWKQSRIKGLPDYNTRYGQTDFAFGEEAARLIPFSEKIAAVSESSPEVLKRLPKGLASYLKFLEESAQ